MRAISLILLPYLYMYLTGDCDSKYYQRSDTSDCQKNKIFYFEIILYLRNFKN